MIQAMKGPSTVLALCILGLGFTIGQTWGAVIEHEEDQEAGFSGYMWGASASDCPSLTRVQELGSTDYVKKVEVYTNPDDSLILNNVPLMSIDYRFMDDRLESIEIKYEGRENREKLRQWVEERYGRLSAYERKTVMQVEWIGDQTGATLTYNPRTNKGTLWFFSRPLFQQYFELFPWSRT